MLLIWDVVNVLGVNICDISIRDFFLYFLENWEFLGIWESHGNGNIPMGMSGNGNGNLFGNFAIFPKSWEFWEWE